MLVDHKVIVSHWVLVYNWVLVNQRMLVNYRLFVSHWMLATRTRKSRRRGCAAGCRRTTLARDTTHWLLAADIVERRFGLTVRASDCWYRRMTLAIIVMQLSRIGCRV